MRPWTPLHSEVPTPQDPLHNLKCNQISRYFTCMVGP